MILGPKQLGSDINVYLTPLIKDLIILWEEGVDVDDVYTSDNFKLRAMLCCTINDIPAYGNLSRYNIKGHKSCPICELDTCHHQLQNVKILFILGIEKF